jgi:hypothetical protein
MGGAAAFGWRSLADYDHNFTAVAAGDYGVNVWTNNGWWDSGPLFQIVAWKDSGGLGGAPWLTAALNRVPLTATCPLRVSLDKRCVAGVQVTDANRARSIVVYIDGVGTATEISQDFSPSTIGALAVEPTDADRLYCATSDGRVWTTDTATTASASTVWSEIADGRPGGGGTPTLTVDASGTPYALLGFPVGSPATPLFSLAADAWTAQACVGYPSNLLANLHAHPLSTGLLYASSGSKVYALNLVNLVWQWQDISENLPGPPVYDLWVGNVGTGAAPKVLLRAAIPTRGAFERDVTIDAGAPIGLYLRDHLLDHGWLSPSADGVTNPFEPGNPAATLYHYMSADIKIDAQRHSWADIYPYYYQTDPESGIPIDHVRFDELLDNSQAVPAGSSIPPAQGGALTSWTSSPDNLQHIAYIGQDGHVYELYRTEGYLPWQYDIPSSKSGPPDAQRGAITSWVSSLDSRQHIAYIGEDGHVYELYMTARQPWQYQPWQYDDPMAMSRAPDAQDGAITSWTTSSDNLQHIAYIGQDGHVYELYMTVGQYGLFQRPWQYDDPTAMSRAPHAQDGAITSWTTSSDNLQHIAYIGQDGHVYELYRNEGQPIWPYQSWRYDGPSGISGAPLAQGGVITSWTTSPDSSQHIAYIGQNGQVCELHMKQGQQPWRYDDPTAADSLRLHVQVHNRSWTQANSAQVWTVVSPGAAVVPSLAASPSNGNNFPFWGQFTSAGKIVPNLPADSPWVSIGPPVTLDGLDASHPGVASWDWTAGSPGHHCVVAFVHSAASLSVPIMMSLPLTWVFAVMGTVMKLAIWLREVGGSGTIGARATTNRLSGGAPRVRLARPSRSLRSGQRCRDPALASSGCRPPAPGQVAEAVAGRPGGLVCAGPAAAQGPPPAAAPDRLPADGAALARRSLSRSAGRTRAAFQGGRARRRPSGRWRWKWHAITQAGATGASTAS